MPGDDASIDESTLRLLARIGAALLESWGELPAALQDRIALRARTLGSPSDHKRARENLARLLDREHHGN